MYKRKDYETPSAAALALPQSKYMSHVKRFRYKSGFFIPYWTLFSDHPLIPGPRLEPRGALSRGWGESGGDRRSCLCSDLSAVVLTPRNLLGVFPKWFQTFAVGVA